jgi:hypothetical protein
LSPCQDPWRLELGGRAGRGVEVWWRTGVWRRGHWSLERANDLGLANFIYTLPCWELELGHHSINLGGIGLLDLLACWADSGFVGKRGWVNGSYT